MKNTLFSMTSVIKRFLLNFAIFSDRQNFSSRKFKSAINMSCYVSHIIGLIMSNSYHLDEVRFSNSSGMSEFVVADRDGRSCVSMVTTVREECRCGKNSFMKDQPTLHVNVYRHLLNFQDLRV